jgi:hypothetical protein
MQRLGARVDSIEMDVKKLKDKAPKIDLLVTVFGRVGLTAITFIVIGIIGSYFVFK